MLEADFREQSGAGLGSFRSDRLPKLDAIPFRIGDPAKLPEVVALAIWVDGDAFGDQTIEQTIQVVDLEIEHGFLRRREVGIVVLEKGEDDLGAMGGSGKRVESAAVHQTEMFFVPLIERFWIRCAQKYTAKAID